MHSCYRSHRSYGIDAGVPSDARAREARQQRPRSPHLETNAESAPCREKEEEMTTRGDTWRDTGDTTRMTGEVSDDGRREGDIRKPGAVRHEKSHACQVVGKTQSLVQMETSSHLLYCHQNVATTQVMAASADVDWQ
ncbi:unnamed protein product [Lampetra fluviatilis]